jgi:DNA-binding XRE family transcriptional regulator
MTTLAQYLKAHDMTQADFAARVGLHQATVSKIAAGSVGASLKTALAIHRATDGKVALHTLIVPSSHAPASDGSPCS